MTLLQHSLTIALKTISESNSTLHWSKKLKLHKAQQWIVRSALQNCVFGPLNLPCKVVLIRLAPRLLDDDNLVSAFKYIRDEIADFIFPEKAVVYQNHKGKYVRHAGHCDKDPRLSWEYSQEKNRKMGIRIEFHKVQELTTTRCLFLKDKE